MENWGNWHYLITVVPPFKLHLCFHPLANEHVFNEYTVISTIVRRQLATKEPAINTSRDDLSGGWRKCRKISGNRKWLGVDWSDGFGGHRKVRATRRPLVTCLAIQPVCVWMHLYWLEYNLRKLEGNVAQSKCRRR